MVQLESVIYYVVSKVKYNNVITLRKIDRSIVVLVLSPLSCSFLNFQLTTVVTVFIVPLKIMSP